jgi:hypothetical protein
VKQAILFENDRGFAFAHNPDAVSPFVSWQFTNDNGDFDHYWGHYCGSEEKALVDYISRAESYRLDNRLKEKDLPEPPAPELPEIKNLIRFIDSEYRELFQIPDGESIRITYPPGDGWEPVERSCNFLDEYHFQPEKSDIYHICQFAEAMERIGATYEPVNQLHNIEILPFTAGEEKFCSNNREEGNTCAGSINGDFGNSGDRYHAYWNERENGLYSAEIQTELQSVIYALRQDILKDRDSMLNYCRNHPEAKLSGGQSHNGDEFSIYGFKLETNSRQYFINCFAAQKDSRFAVYAHADKPTRNIEHTDLAVHESPTIQILQDVNIENPGFREVSDLTLAIQEIDDFLFFFAKAILSADLASVADVPSLIEFLHEDNLYRFNIIDARNAAELGEYWQTNEPDAIPDGMSAEEYGQHCVDNEKGIFTDHGYVYERERADFKSIVSSKLEFDHDTSESVDESKSKYTSVLKAIRDGKAEPKPVKADKVRTKKLSKGDDAL